jgi:hypothetical protein
MMAGGTQAQSLSEVPQRPYAVPDGPADRELLERFILWLDEAASCRSSRRTRPDGAEWLPARAGPCAGGRTRRGRWVPRPVEPRCEHDEIPPLIGAS